MHCRLWRLGLLILHYSGYSIPLRIIFSYHDVLLCYSVSCHYDKMPERINLKEKRFMCLILAEVWPGFWDCGGQTVTWQKHKVRKTAQIPAPENKRVGFCDKDSPPKSNMI